MPYLHVYRVPSGEWSGKVLDEVAGIGGCDNPKDVWEAASEQFPDIIGLPGLAYFKAPNDETVVTGDDNQGRHTRQRQDSSPEVIEGPDSDDTAGF